MAERRENSVLIALRELRGVEDNRVETEEKKRQAAAEQARLQAEAAAQSKREEDARIRREAEEAEQARLDAVERGKREERLHAQSIENKARVEAQMVIDQERMRLEMGARAEQARRTKPVGLIVAAVALLIIIGGLGVYVMNQQAESARLTAEKAAQLKELAALEKAKQEMESQMQAQLDAIQNSKNARNKLLARIDETDDPAERQRLYAQLEKEKNAEKAAEARMKEIRRKQKNTAERKRKAREKSGPKCDPSDPLCGI